MAKKKMARKKRATKKKARRLGNRISNLGAGSSELIEVTASELLTLRKIRLIVEENIGILDDDFSLCAEGQRAVTELKELCGITNKLDVEIRFMLEDLEVDPNITDTMDLDPNDFGIEVTYQGRLVNSPADIEEIL